MRPLTIVAFVFLLAACGWHLRGSVGLPDQLKSPYLTGKNVDAGMRQLVSQRLRDAGATEVKTISDASAVIELTATDYRKRQVAVTADGQPSTYELLYQLSYRFRLPDGSDQYQSGQVQATLNYQYDSNQILSKENEENRLVKQLRDEVSLRLLQQLTLKVSNAN